MVARNLDVPAKREGFLQFNNVRYGFLIFLNWLRFFAFGLACFEFSDLVLKREVDIGPF